MWARHYGRCVNCGTVDRKHLARGLCTRCYRQATELRYKNKDKHKKRGIASKILTRQFLEEEYLSQKLSTIDVARIAGCGRQLVYQKLVEYGIPRRSLKSARKLAIERNKVTYANRPNSGKMGSIVWQKLDDLDLLQRARLIGNLIDFVDFNASDSYIDMSLAYIAGLFDAEVAIMIHGGSLRISYTKTNRRILEYLQNIFGGTIQPVKKQPSNRFPVWRWNLLSGYAYKALRKLEPFLRIKREHARICIEFYESCCNPGGGWRTEKQIILSRKYADLLRNHQSKSASRVKEQ